MSRSILRFGDCRLDIAARELVRGGERVDLPPIVFDCIAYLIARRDRAVGRDELVAAVWGRSEISDTMLGKAILAARRAVGDNAEAQALIRTVPRFGYHWIGAVREDTEDSPPDAEPAARTGTRRIALAAAVGVVLALAAVAWIAMPRSDRTGNASTAASTADTEAPAGATAVLPVDVLARPEDAWLRLGLMDLIANRLRDAGVPVMSSDSVVGLLRRNDADVDDLRQRLHRAHPRLRLVEASITRRGSQWMLHATIGERGVDASAGDPMAAARTATDRLLETLGRHPAAATRDGGDLTLESLLQRTEAARLADDLDAARSLIEAAPPALRERPEVRLSLAQIETRAGHLEEARRQLRDLLGVLPAETEPALRARVLASLCSVDNQLDHAEDSVRACSEAIDLGSAHGAAEAVAIAYNNRAISHSRSRDFAAAEADFARARVAFQRDGDMLALVRVSGNEASMLMARGRPAEALPIFEEAGRRFDAFGLANESLIAIVNEIDANLELLQPADALAASERGWAILPRVPDTNLKHQLQRLRAEALAANGRFGEAHALLDSLIGSLDDDPASEILALARGSQARIELDAGHPESAAVLARQAMAGLPTPEDYLRRARAARIEALALYRLGRAAKAADALDRFVRWSSTADTPAASFYAELAAGEIDASATDADPHYERASAIAANLNLPSLVANAAVSYGSALIARGELERAAIVVGRVAHYSETDYDSALLEARLYRALGEREAWQAALTRVRRLAGERRIPPQVSDFAKSSTLAGASPNLLGTVPER